MRNKLLTVFFSFICSFTFAQKEDVNWILQNGVLLNFSDSQTTVQTTVFALATRKTACISDKEGNLLLYSDGQKIYDRNNELIYSLPSNLGYTYDGNYIIPCPQTADTYYLISFPKPMTAYCSLLMHTIQVQTPFKVIVNSTQIISQDTILNAQFNGLVRHTNTTDYWLLTGQGKKIESFLITKNGISTSPNIFTFDINFSTHITTSPNERKLVFYSDGNLCTLDFDATNGYLSNLKKILYNNLGYTPPIEFSPDGTKLFTLTNHSEQSYQIKQYDANLLDYPDLFLNSACTVSTISEMTHLITDLKSNPNGNIYAAMNGYSYVGSIKNPNEKPPACYFIQNDLYLNGKKNGFYFPFFFPPLIPYLSTNINCTQVDFRCLNSTPQSAFWTFGDGSTSTEMNPVHTYFNSGTYKVEVLVNYTDGSSQTLSKTITIEGKPSKPNIWHD